jgi:hypothetical protein
MALRRILRRGSSARWLPGGLLVSGLVAAAFVVAPSSALGRSTDQPGLPEQPDIISLAPLSETNYAGELVTHTATIAPSVSDKYRIGVTVTFTVLEGPSTGRTFTGTTDGNGQASFMYTIPSPGLPLPSLPNAGADQIQASFFDGDLGGEVGSNWVGQGWSQAAVGQTVPGHPPALVQVPGTTGFVAANPTQDLPPGTTVDVSGRRAMSILNYYDRRMLFIGVPDKVPSRFVLINGLRTAGKAIRIKLTGGNFSQCASPKRALEAYSSGAKKKKNKPVRRLWGSGKGRYVTTGKYASADVRGTFWEVADYCNGTLIKVRSGRVVVHDLVHHKTIILTSGHAYFVKST